ncbi:MAG: hypothetical protein RI911_153 [Candidatus Parcubacteria bacterium]|jgi:hypothetical protein
MSILKVFYKRSLYVVGLVAAACATQIGIRAGSEQSTIDSVASGFLLQVANADDQTGSSGSATDGSDGSDGGSDGSDGSGGSCSGGSCSGGDGSDGSS